MANNLNRCIVGRVVVLSKKAYKGPVINRLFKCENGFGCWDRTIGTAVFGHFLKDGEEARVNGYDIARIATSEEKCSVKIVKGQADSGA